MATKRSLFEISKVDKTDDGGRVVSGVWSAEVGDFDDEIFDYAGLKACMISDWPGNVREQHDPFKPVGTAALAEIQFDDTAKTIAGQVFITPGAPETIQKIDDGVLKFFSVNARLRRGKDGRTLEMGTTWDGQEKLLTRLHPLRMIDLSLVDSPGCPVEEFTVAKNLSEKEPNMKQEDVAKAFLAKVEAAGLTPKLGPSVSEDVMKVGFDPNGYAWGCEESTADALKALYALSIVEELIGSESYEGEADQVAMLQGAQASLQDYIAASVKEPKAPLPEPMKADAGKADAAPQGEVPPDPAPPEEPAADAAQVPEPDAPKADAAEVASAFKCVKCGGAMPDKCAQCAKDDAGMADAGKALASPPEPPPDLNLFISEAVSKALAPMQSDLTAAKSAFETYRAESEAEKAALKAEVEKMGAVVMEAGRPMGEAMKGGGYTPENAASGGIPVEMVADIVANHIQDGKPDMEAIHRDCALAVSVEGIKAAQRAARR